MKAVGSFVTPVINYPVLHRSNNEGLSRHLLFDFENCSDVLSSEIKLDIRARNISTALQ